MKARDLLAFYVEHVIRTNGAKHLSPPPLSLCSRLLIDVAAVILIPLVCLAFTILYAFSKCCYKKKNHTKDDKKKTNKKHKKKTL